MIMHSIYSNPRPVAVHTIGQRVFRVYAHFVMYEDHIIYKSCSEIISSVLLGNTFAMACRDGNLLVPSGCELSAETFSEPLSLARQSISMYVPLFTVTKIAGSPDGRYIVVKSVINSILLLFYNQKDHSLELVGHREMDLSGVTQITYEDGFPCLWNLVYNNADFGGVFVELYNLDPLEPLSVEAVPFARCPLMAEIDRVENEPEMYACSVNDRTGVLCKIDGNVFFLGYRQAIVGDFASKRCVCPFEAPEISEASLITENGIDRLIYVSRSDLTVAAIDPAAEGSRVFTASDPVARFPSFPISDLFAWCVVNAEFSPSLGETNLPFVYIEPTNFPVSKILIDSRKIPWRIVALEEHGVKLISTTKAIDEMVRTKTKQVHNLFYEPKLSTVIATSQYGTTRYLSGPDIENLPRLHNSESLVHFGMVENHTLVLVYPTEVELYSGMFPFPHICTTTLEEGPVIGAAIGLGILVVRTFDQVFLLHLNNPKLTTHDMQNGLWNKLDTGKAPITFVSCENSRILVGLDLSRQIHRKWVNSLEILNTKAMRRFVSQNETARGCVLVFSNEGLLYDLQLHPHPPSGYQLFTASDLPTNVTKKPGIIGPVEFVAYGALGLITWVRALDTYISIEDLDEDEMLITESPEQENVLVRRYGRTSLTLSQPISWAGSTLDGKGVLLRGRGIYIVTPETCEQLELGNETQNRTQHFISSALAIGLDTVAFVEKQQLRLARDTNLLNGARPYTIRRMKLSNAGLMDMLLIKSQRLLVLYGKSGLRILDSSTLQPLQPKSTSHYIFGRSVALWRFVDANGTAFEQVVTFDGRRTLESCSFERSGNKVSLELKFRFTLNAAYIDSENNSEKDLIMPIDDLIYLCTGHWLIIINPVLGIVYDEFRLGASAMHISFALEYVIVTTEPKILVLKRFNGKLSLYAEIKHTSIKFFKHVAQIVPSEYQARNHIYILAMAKELELKYFILKGFIVQDKQIVPMEIPKDIKSYYPVLFARDIIADPGAPETRDHLLCYVVTVDQTIQSVKISPHDTELSHNNTRF